MVILLSGTGHEVHNKLPQNKLKKLNRFVYNEGLVYFQKIKRIYGILKMQVVRNLTNFSYMVFTWQNKYCLGIR